jgi:cellulose synthase/poly-beta-1,6-N-acetylglucosamine synthase-like glycosyltransferase
MEELKFIGSLLEWFGFFYIMAFILAFLAIYGTSTLLTMLYQKRTKSQDMIKDNAVQYPPVSILVPAYNEEAVIIDSLELLFNLDYPEYEVVVVNDGSSDNTIKVLTEYYDLQPISTAHPGWVKSAPIVAVYRSPKRPNLVVVDKINGRKADALNSALNFSQYPIYCCIDADSYIRPDGLLRCIQPFLNDPKVVGVGCAIRVMEGAKVTGKNSVEGGVPFGKWRNVIVGFQIVEYLLAFTMARMVWTGVNATPLISGAFAMYNKEIVIQAGGYRSGCIGDDSDMTLRVHQYLTLINPRPYRIKYVPEPICWTQVPTDWKSLWSQRIRWQRGLSDGILERPKLFLNPKHPGLGFLAIPFLLLFEMINPLFDFAGVFVLGFGTLFGFVDFHNYLISLFFIFCFWNCLTAFAILYDQLSFKTYRNKWDIPKMIALTLMMAVGYFHFKLFARLLGLYQQLTNQKKSHGHMARHAMTIPSGEANRAAA